MKQYTDERLSFDVEGLDLTTITNLHMTFSQPFGSSFTSTDVDVIDATHGSVLVTQEQTALLKPGEVKVQLNFFDETGLRDATDEGVLPVESNLLRRILDNGN